MISNSLAYAIKALIYIAANTSDAKRVTLKEICNSTEIPKPYVAKILQDLVRNNVLSSIKGPNGGFYFSKKELNTKLLTIVEILEGPDKYRKCLLELKDCDASNPCPLHENIGQVRSEFLRQLEQITIRELKLHKDSF